MLSANQLEIRRRYRNKNRELLRAKGREYAKKNRFRMNLWLEKNKEKMKTCHKKWYLKNRDKIIERSKLWKLHNKDKYLFWREKYYFLNREKALVAEKIECRCGCGIKRTSFNLLKKNCEYVNGHSSRIIHFLERKKYGNYVHRTENFFRRCTNYNTGAFPRDIVFLVLFYLLTKAKTKGEETIMNANTLMSEIKSNALKQIADSLNTTLNNIQTKKIDIKQGVAEIIAHKHIIQTIALDWTFNGVAKGVKQIVHSQK